MESSIIITGANSGIGFECALQMAKLAPNEQIILACRNVQAGNEAINKIKSNTNHQNLLCLSLDLASLQSVRDFKKAFLELPNTRVAVLINNAGIAPNIRETAYTKDGFEITFGTNHLGGFYLTMLLLPYIKQGGSITFTASDTHDPAAKAGIEPPIYKSAKKLAFPEKMPGKVGMKLGQRRYSTSKLCNVMTAYSFHKKVSDKNIRVNAFDPGLTPGTGFTKNFPAPLHFVVSRIMPLFISFKKNMNSPQTSGQRLANLAYAKELRHLNGIYYSDGKVIKSSTDSYNEDFQKDLWKTSIELTGVKKEDITTALT